MDVNKMIIILIAAAIISLVMLWWGAKTAHIEEPPPPPKFEPRKMTDLSKDIPVAPKKKHYRKNYKKKPIDGNKKPVGRPKKSE